MPTFESESLYQAAEDAKGQGLTLQQFVSAAITAWVEQSRDALRSDEREAVRICAKLGRVE